MFFRSKPKVFVIGLNKTGTTSLGDALSTLGYARRGWNEFLSRKLFHDWHSGNLKPLINWTKLYEAFEDFPWPLVYEEMATLYPDAKFILSMRKDEERWFQSIAAHSARRPWIGHEVIYGAVIASPETKELYLTKYREHNERVREFFRDQPGRLLEICVEDSSDGNWIKLCEFVGRPDVPTKQFPKSNPKEAFWNVDHIGVFKSWASGVDWIERALLRVL